MLAIHLVHRRLAELTFISKKRRLKATEQLEMFHCLEVNAKIVSELDSLKQVALHAHEMGDMDWQMDLCAKIEGLEVKMI
jgi:hypothetical protein